MTQKEFEPSVRGGFEKDNAFHVRNLNAIKEHLLTSFVGPGQLSDGAVTEGALAPGAVTDAAVGDVSVTKLTSGILTAIATLQGAIETGNLRFDGEGITLLDDDGGVLVSIPSVGTPFLRANLEALGLLIEGGMVLRGTDNLIEPGARLILGGAGAGTTVGDPPAAPGWKIEWERFLFGEAGLKRGISWDATNTSWWTTTNPFTEAFGGRTVTHPASVRELESGTLTEIRNEDVHGVEKMHGAVRVGTRVFVLFEATTGQTLIRAFSESGLAYLGQTNTAFGINGGIHGNPCIGYDGTHLIICDLDGEGAGSEIRFHKYTVDNAPTYVSTTASSGASNPGFNEETGALRGFVSAESLWWVGIGGSGQNRVEAFSTAGVHSDDNEFDNGEVIRGLAHDGTRFWTLSSDGLVKHTNWKWTTESSVYDVGYTYVDDNGAASAGARPLAAGDFETRSSPLARLTMKRRARLRVSAAAVDTATGITHVGWYVNRGNLAPDFKADDAVVDEVPTVHLFDDFVVDASPETAPSSNNFPAGASGFAELVTSDGMPILRGNGTIRSKVQKTTNQSFADATEATVDMSGATESGTDAMLVAASDWLSISHTAQFLVVLNARWAASNVGRRQVHLETSPTGAVWTSVASAGAIDNRRAATDGNTTSGFSCLLDLTAAHKLRIRAVQNSGAALDLADWNLQLIQQGPQ